MRKHAGVAQWQSSSFPSWSRGFDSHRPLQYRINDSEAPLQYRINDSEAIIGSLLSDDIFKEETSNG